MIKWIKKYTPFDKILTIEAMGIPITTAISIELKVPFTVIRKRKYGLDGEIEINQKTGYSESKLYINGLNDGDEVVIVDDIISTGGTLKAVLDGLKKIDVNVKCAVVAINKGFYLKGIIDEFKVPVISIIDINAFDNQLVD